VRVEEPLICFIQAGLPMLYGMICVCPGPRRARRWRCRRVRCLQHQTLGDFLAPAPFRRVVLAAGDVQVHVPVAGMAEGIGDEAVGFDFGLHGPQQLGVAVMAPPRP